MMNRYLRLNVTYFITCVIILSFIFVYIQQKYVLIPQLNNNNLFNEIIKGQILEQFYKYRWISFGVTPLLLLLRINLVAICFFVGGFLFDTCERLKYSTCFNITIKSDVIPLSYSILYSIFVITLGYEEATQILLKSSLLCFFDIETIEPWLAVLIALFNIFELLYWLFLAKLLSVATHKSYRNSLNFVISTYGVGFFLYLLFLMFIMLYVTQ